MEAMRSRNRLVTQGHDVQAVEGIRKNLQGATVLHLGARTFTPSSLEARVQARIDAANAIAAARARWLDAVAVYDAIDPDVYLVVRDLQHWVVAAFGEESPVMAEFGFQLRKKAVMTPEQKEKAIARRAATRKARRTLGPKARLAVKGTPPPTETVPTTIRSPTDTPEPNPNATHDRDGEPQ
jgi:hypothetical protein